MATAPVPLKDRRGRVYTPALGTRMKRLLAVIFACVALLGANSVYLAAITSLEWFSGQILQTPFYLLMFALHLVLGVGLTLPFVVFAGIHLVTAWNRPNKSAIRHGIALLIASVVIIATGLLLIRLEGFAINDPRLRSAGYWLHVLAPLAAIGLYVRHRLAGPRIQWRAAKVWGVSVAAFTVAMAMLHSHDPREYTAKASKEGARYFFPSDAVTSTGNFIPASTLMMDDYCLKCHKDAYDSWFHSSHHFSSFNNPAYLASVKETREFSEKRDGTPRAARWCAGCHDPVPLFSGEFDKPEFDFQSAAAQAGITCTSCHSVTSLHSTRGNGDYTIEEPMHYPFASNANPLLQWVNNTLVKAKPELHKKTFLKPIHLTSEFCSTCHKVGLPFALNHYKDFLRGQNHYDTYLLSGVSGHGARSFYYPPEAKSKCVDCHMNLLPSRDFGARDFDGKGGVKIHNHLFLGANTGLAKLIDAPDALEAHTKFLQDKKARVDLFALREGGAIDGAFLGPLRPETPTLEEGRKYLVEVVVRTLALGHPLTQGTVDSNEIWVELIAKAGNRIIGRSGGIDEQGQVDPYSHFINVFMLDKDGKRIDRRNPQDIFVPLYNKQIPPGAGQVVHFGLSLPKEISGPIVLEAKLNYRKFDRTYMDFVFAKEPEKRPILPVVVMASDTVSLAVKGGAQVSNPPSPITEGWQRWNDYGIGLLLEGGDKGGQKGELLQAEQAFRKVTELGKADGWVNLARVYIKEGRIPDAREALVKASNHPEPAASWVIAWLNGQTNELNGFLDEAIRDYESVLGTKIPARKFDFSLDYEVINRLGNVLYGRARQERRDSPNRAPWLEKAVAAFRRTYALDNENVTAHYGLGLGYSEVAQGHDPALNLPRLSDVPIDQPADPEAVLALAKVVADPATPSAQRLIQSRELSRQILILANGPRPQANSRLNTLLSVVDRINPVWEIELQPEARAALAGSFATLHKTLHAIYKPDETAEGRAVRLARERDRAANHNAQSIVIHDLHRQNAPGVEPGVAEKSQESSTVAAREEER